MVEPKTKQKEGYCQEKSLSSFPLVSVIIPTYNADNHIKTTLNSVRSQTYKNIEVIVIDDGSQDQTAEIVRSVAQQDGRIILLQQPNSGVAAARNFGIQKAQGELIAPIDADDIWYPENLEKQLQCFLQAEPSVGLVYGWSVDLDKSGLPTGEFRASQIEGEVYKTLICHNFLGNSSASLIRSDCLEKVGGYNCKLKENNAQGCEDWELYLRLAEHYQFRVVPEFLIGYRKIFSSMSCDHASMAKSHTLILQSVRQKYPEIPAVLYRLSSSSFYMYLARQSSQQAHHKSTLFWVRKALQVDGITPLFRYGLYALSIKSLFGIHIQPVVFQFLPKHPSSMPFKQWLSSKHRVVTLSDFNQGTMSIRFKLLAGSLLHRLLLTLSGKVSHA